MTLKETKDKVSQSLGYEDWKELVKDQSNFTDAGFDLIVTNVAKAHASNKTEDALKLGAEKATIYYYSAHGYDCAKVSEESILSLLPELLETINKEI